jgi:hypothetical protein
MHGPHRPAGCDVSDDGLMAVSSRVRTGPHDGDGSGCVLRHDANVDAMLPSPASASAWLQAQIAAILAWSAGTAPATPVRWLAEPDLHGFLPADADTAGEGLTGGDLLAAAAGLAVATGAHRDWLHGLGIDRAQALGLPHDRPARVVVLLRRAMLFDSHGLSAIALVRGLGSIVDVLLVDGHGTDGDRLHSLGIRPIGPHWSHQPQATACLPPTGAEPIHGSGTAPHPRREWPPVNLTGLPAGLAAPLVDPATPPGPLVDGWLDGLSLREPRLLLPHASGWWPQQPKTQSTLLALSQVAGQGIRVFWRLPTGTDLRRWAAVLDWISRAGLPIKLLVDAADLPPADWCQLRQGWWIAGPCEAGEALAVLFWALAHEDCAIISLPTVVLDNLPAWPADEAWMPGSGRWIVPGDSGAVVCRGDQAARAMALRRGREALLACTSISPLPEADLLAAAATGPLRATNPMLTALKTRFASHPAVRIVST